MTLSEKLILNLNRLGLNPEYVEKIANESILEDLGGGADATSLATIPEKQKSTAEFVSRKAGIIAGLNVAAAVLESQGITDYQILVAEGSEVAAGDIVLRAHGNTRKILTAERTCLNLLGRLSGIATLTNKWVNAVSGTKTQIRDTRKTTPLLRGLEKFAVRTGGGVNHRMSLSDAALIKDNHVLAAGGVLNAFRAIKNSNPDISLEVEVDSLDQLKEMVEAGAELILLDNMAPEDCKRAVEIVAGRCKLEASGGLTLEKARAYAETGVDYLAVGALTHSAPVLDIGLDLRME